jgi:hypothetical protein
LSLQNYINWRDISGGIMAEETHFISNINR